MEFIQTPDGRYIAEGLYFRYGVCTFFSQDFLPFEEAREFVRKLKLKNEVEWEKYCISGEKPNNIPSTLRAIYKNGWKGMGDFLGTGNRRSTEFLFFKEARKIIRDLKLKNVKEWESYRVSFKRPNNIPSSPNNTYKDKGWISWGDFLGTGNIGSKEKDFLSFVEVRKFVKKLKLKNVKEWYKYCESDEKPDNIPFSPYHVYRDKGWIDFGDFLGTGYKRNTSFLSFEEVRAFVRRLKFKTIKGWKEYCRSGKRPDNIPSHPDRVYKNKGWISWSDFLGTKK